MVDYVLRDFLEVIGVIISIPLLLLCMLTYLPTMLDG